MSGPLDTQLDEMADRDLCRTFVSTSHAGDAELAGLLADEIRARGLKMPEIAVEAVGCGAPGKPVAE